MVKNIERLRSYFDMLRFTYSYAAHQRQIHSKGARPLQGITSRIPIGSGRVLNEGRSGGRSEELIGAFIAERKLRDRIVLATNYSFSGGNGRKNLHRALEASLKRLGTDYIDLFWMHVWGAVTPAEEILQSMGDLVRAGKIRYFGLSDVPAWFAARMGTLAQAHNVPGPIALQLVYSLCERIIEHEHIPAARELAMGITPWSPLGAGFLTGKYKRDASGNVTAAGGRLDSNNQPFRMFTERNWKIL